MSLFRNKKQETKEQVVKSIKPVGSREQIQEAKIRRELEQLSRKGASPLEMARTAAQMRSDFEDDLILTVDELTTKRSKKYCEQLSRMNDEDLLELFTEFFVTRRVNAAKDTMSDLELEDLRTTNETYVTKLMAMSKEERLIEFKRIDDEKLHAAQNSNDENIFKYLLAKEVEALPAGTPAKEIESLKNSRLIEFVIGQTHYTEEEQERASVELEYKDLTEGTSYIIDTKHIPSLAQQLCLTKTEMDLQKLVSSKLRK